VAGSAWQRACSTLQVMAGPALLLASAAHRHKKGTDHVAQDLPRRFGPRQPGTAGAHLRSRLGADPGSRGVGVAVGIRVGECRAELISECRRPTATVTINNLSFGKDLTVAAGTTVVFDNKDVVAHTATNGTNGVAAKGALFDLALPVGGSASYTFKTAGTYQVTCKLHPAMNMTITVH
jgi:plastocyanin